jgi:hypothetical protein
MAARRRKPRPYQLRYGVLIMVMVVRTDTQLKRRSKRLRLCDRGRRREMDLAGPSGSTCGYMKVMSACTTVIRARLPIKIFPRNANHIRLLLCTSFGTKPKRSLSPLIPQGTKLRWHDEA